MSASCSHLDSGRFTALLDSIGGCEDSLATGGRWVHLRMCQSCGHIGCCDSSANRYATAQARGAARAIVRHADPREDWGYCYIDDVAFVLAG
jgi:hypothetical protein